MPEEQFNNPMTFRGCLCKRTETSVHPMAKLYLFMPPLLLIILAFSLFTISKRILALNKSK